MKILVTGATGTVGGHIVRKLQCHEVVALVRDPSAVMPAGVTAVTGNLTDRDAVNRALEGVDRAFLILADDSGAVFAQAAAEAARGAGHGRRGARRGSGALSRPRMSNAED